MKKIIQVTPSISKGDATSNDLLALKDALDSYGIQNAYYADVIQENAKDLGVKSFFEYKNKEDDIVIFHFSIMSRFTEYFKNYKGKKWVIYHNVTPHTFFEEYDDVMVDICKGSIQNISSLKDTVDLCIADSEFNKENLIEMGYKCPIEVLPILIRFSDYDKEANEEIIKKYRGDGYTNILFTGRVAPNKKQEDIIESFYYYKKNINEKSRLFIVGGYGKEDKYYKRLKRYVEEIGIEDVIFTGHIPFADILGYYRASDIFLCLSEHEGFCVPLVEAMYFGIPIIAYDSTAIKETLGGSGLLLEDKNPKKVAEAIDIIEKDKDLREKIIENEKERLEYFSYDNISKKFLDILVKYK